LVLVMDDTFLTIEEIAERLRVSRNTVVSLIDRGELPAIRVRRQYRVKESDFLDFANRYINKPSAEEEK
jgi:excisionase family DNA binding protein